MVNGPRIFAKCQAERYFSKLPHQPGAQKALERRLLRNRNRNDREYIKRALKRGLSLEKARGYLQLFRSVKKLGHFPIPPGRNAVPMDTFAGEFQVIPSLEKKYLTITRSKHHRPEKDTDYYLKHFLGDPHFDTDRNSKTLEESILSIDPGNGKVKFASSDVVGGLRG